MSFAITDIILAVIVLAFAIAGFFAGFIKSLGTIVAFFAGAVLATSYFDQFGSLLSPIIGNHMVTAKIVAFFLIFIVVNLVVLFIFYLLGKVFRIISFIPFLSSLNRLAGLLLGFIEGVLLTGLFIYIMVKIIPDSSFVATLEKSQIANFLVAVMAFIGNLIN